MQACYLVVVAQHDIEIHVRGVLQLTRSALVFQQTVTPVGAVEGDDDGQHEVLRIGRKECQRAGTIVYRAGVVLYDRELDGAREEQLRRRVLIYFLGQTGDLREMEIHHLCRQCDLFVRETQRCRQCTGFVELID